MSGHGQLVSNRLRYKRGAFTQFFAGGNGVAGVEWAPELVRGINLGVGLPRLRGPTVSSRPTIAPRQLALTGA